MFSVVSTPGENKQTPGLGPPVAAGDFLVRSERAAPDTAHNSSGNIVTLNMIRRKLFIDEFFF